VGGARSFGRMEVVDVALRNGMDVLGGGDEQMSSNSFALARRYGRIR